MAEGPIRALTGRRRTRPPSTGCRNPWQPEPGRAPPIAAQAAVQTNGATSLIRDHDAALGQELLDITEAEREPEINRNHALDDIAGEAVAGVRQWACYPATMPRRTRQGRRT